MIATRAPELGWSPEVRQTIASWTKPLAGPKTLLLSFTQRMSAVRVVIAQ